MVFNMTNHDEMNEQHKENQNEDLSKNQSDVLPKGNIALNILIFIGWMILAQLPIIIILTITNLSVKMDTLKATMSTVLYLIVVSVVVWLIRRYYRRHTYEHTDKFTTKDIGINIGWAVLLRIIVYAFLFLLYKVTGSAQTSNDKLLFGDMNQQATNASQLAQVFPFIIFVITISFIAPYLEELIYRGIFKETLFKKTSFWLPFIISSIVFGSQHGINNIISFIMYTSMGMVFYLAYSRRGNIKDSMMVHMIHNSIIGIAILVGYFYIMFK